MEWITHNWAALVAALPAIMALASMVVRLTPTHDDDRWYQVAIDTLGRLGIYRDNGNGSYSHKIPLIHSAKPKKPHRVKWKPPVTAILLAASVTSASCARPLATAKQSYAQARETYRTTVLEVAVDLRAAGYVSDQDWAVFLVLHEKVRRADAMLKATLIAAERVSDAAERDRLLKDAGVILADLVRLVAQVAEFVDALKCDEQIGGSDTCYPRSMQSSHSGIRSRPEPVKPWSMRSSPLQKHSRQL